MVRQVVYIVGLGQFWVLNRLYDSLLDLVPDNGIIFFEEGGVY